MSPEIIKYSDNGIIWGLNLGKTLELLGTVERNAPALEKAAQATGLGGNLNPLNWKTNALIALSSGAIKKMYGKEDDDISLPEPEVSENNKGIE